jgi:hypothetical protein
MRNIRRCRRRISFHHSPLRVRVSRCVSTWRTSAKRRLGSAAMHLRIAADHVRRNAGDRDSGATGGSRVFFTAMASGESSPYGNSPVNIS